MGNSNATIKKCIRVYTMSRVRTINYTVEPNKPVILEDPQIMGYELFDLITIEHPFGEPIYDERNFSKNFSAPKTPFSKLIYDGVNVRFE